MMNAIPANTRPAVHCCELGLHAAPVAICQMIELSSGQAAIKDRTAVAIEAVQLQQGRNSEIGEVP